MTLNNVFGKGKMDNVYVSAASDQQICALWQATEEAVSQKYVDDCRITIAQKSEDDTGLNRFNLSGW